MVKYYFPRAITPYLYPQPTASIHRIFNTNRKIATAGYRLSLRGARHATPSNKISNAVYYNPSKVEVPLSVHLLELSLNLVQLFSTCGHRHPQGKDLGCVSLCVSDMKKTKFVKRMRWFWREKRRTQCCHSNDEYCTFILLCEDCCSRCKPALSCVVNR